MSFPTSGEIGDASYSFLGNTRIYRVDANLTLGNNATVTGRDVTIAGNQLSNAPSSATLDLENCVLDLNMSTLSNSVLSRLNFENTRIISNNQAYRVFGVWENTTNSQPWVWRGVPFAGQANQTTIEVGLSIFIGGLNINSIFEGVSFWNGLDLGSGASGCLAQLGGHLIFSKPVFPPLGARFNGNQAPANHRLLARWGVQNLSGSSSIQSYQGWNLEPDFRAWSQIDNSTNSVATGTLLCYIDVDANGNIIIINPIYGRPQGTNSTLKWVTVFFAGGSNRGGRARVFMGTNPVCSDVNVLYTFPSSRTGQIAQVPATFTQTANFNTFLTGQTLSNPQNGFMFLTQDYNDNVTPSYSSANYAQADTNGVNIAALPTSITYRQYSWTQQGTQAEFGREITLSPPREYNGRNAADDADQTISEHNAEVAASRQTGFDDISNAGWQSSTDLNTLLDIFVSELGIATPSAAGTSITGNTTKTATQIAVLLKRHAWLLVTDTNISTGNRQVMLPYSYANGVLSITGILNLGGSTGAIIASVNDTSDASELTYTSFTLSVPDITQTETVPTIAATTINIVSTFGSQNITNKAILQGTVNFDATTNKTYRNLAIDGNLNNVRSGHTISGLTITGSRTVSVIASAGTYDISNLLGTGLTLDGTITLISNNPITVNLAGLAGVTAGANVTFNDSSITVNVPGGFNHLIEIYSTREAAEGQTISARLQTGTSTVFNYSSTSLGGSTIYYRIEDSAGNAITEDVILPSSAQNTTENIIVTPEQALLQELRNQNSTIISNISEVKADTDRIPGIKSVTDATLTKATDNEAKLDQIDDRISFDEQILAYSPTLAELTLDPETRFTKSTITNGFRATVVGSGGVAGIDWEFDRDAVIPNNVDHRLEFEITSQLGTTQSEIEVSVEIQIAGATGAIPHTTQMLPQFVPGTVYSISVDLDDRIRGETIGTLIISIESFGAIAGNTIDITNIQFRGTPIPLPQELEENLQTQLMPIAKEATLETKASQASADDANRILAVLLHWSRSVTRHLDDTNITNLNPTSPPGTGATYDSSDADGRATFRIATTWQAGTDYGIARYQQTNALQLDHDVKTIIQVRIAKTTGSMTGELQLSVNENRNIELSPINSPSTVTITTTEKLFEFDISGQPLSNALLVQFRPTANQAVNQTYTVKIDRLDRTPDRMRGDIESVNNILVNGPQDFRATISIDDDLLNVLDTTVASLTSQTVFTTAAGPPGDTAFRNSISRVTKPNGSHATVIIASYQGSSRQFTLREAPTGLTIAVGDTFEVLSFVASATLDISGLATTAQLTAAQNAINAQVVTRATPSNITASQAAIVTQILTRATPANVTAVQTALTALINDKASTTELTDAESNLTSLITTSFNFISARVKHLGIKSRVNSAGNAIEYVSSSNVIIATETFQNAAGTAVTIASGEATQTAWS